MNENHNINLTIVDDNLEMAYFLKELLLTTYHQIERVDVFPNAEQFIQCFDEINTDVVLMDLELPKMSGAECIHLLKDRKSTTQFIAFTVFGDDQNVFNALRAGATGYILKTEPHDKIFEAVQLVLSGGSPMTPSISRMVIDYFQNPVHIKINPDLELTKRECEILELLDKGKKYKEIAEELFISIDTVRTHIRNIYIKLEVNNKTSAINKYKS